MASLPERTEATNNTAQAQVVLRDLPNIHSRKPLVNDMIERQQFTNTKNPLWRDDSQDDQPNFPKMIAQELANNVVDQHYVTSQLHAGSNSREPPQEPRT